MHSEEKTINDVIEFWNRNFVHSVEFKKMDDLKTWLEDIDNLRWSDNEKWARKSFWEFEGGVGKRMLDAGCGIGVFSRFYAKKGFEVHAIDISQRAVEITQKGFEMFGLDGRVSLGSVEKIPYPDNYFDYVVSNGVIHHTPNSEKAVEEFYRVIKPGGVACVCVYYKNALLRRPIFNIARHLLKLVLKKREGREKLLLANTPEEFVRSYDGNDTPIAKVYTRKQAEKLFKNFQILRAEIHYFPVRFLHFLKVGGIIHKFLDNYFGTLIYFLLKKVE